MFKLRNTVQPEPEMPCTEGSGSRRRRDAETTRPSHSIKPGRRRNLLRCRASGAVTASRMLLCIVLVFIALCSTAEARVAHKPMPPPRSIQVGRRAAGLVDRGGAHGDRQVGPVILDLVERQDPLTGDGNHSGSDKTTTKGASKTTASATAAATTGSSASAPTDTSLPKVFDSNLGNNFTQPACPNFFNNFRNANDFANCLPFSLLLQNSQSFFMASASQSSLRHILDATCDIVFSHCKDVMSSYASQIRDDSNCGADYRLGNPLVVAAYIGFQAYEPMYKAACLKASSSPSSGSSNGASDASTNSDDDYCFVSSTDVNAAPADNYIYSLPLGVPLPGASRPTCSPCLKKTMQFFADAAQNMSTPLSKDYSAAALQVNSGCGPNWVNSSVKPMKGTGDGSESGAGALRVPAAAIAATISVVIGQMFL